METYQADAKQKENQFSDKNLVSLRYSHLFVLHKAPIEQCAFQVRSIEICSRVESSEAETRRVLIPLVQAGSDRLRCTSTARFWRLGVAYGQP